MSCCKKSKAMQVIMCLTKKEKKKEVKKLSYATRIRYLLFSVPLILSGKHFFLCQTQRFLNGYYI